MSSEFVRGFAEWSAKRHGVEAGEMQIQDVIGQLGPLLQSNWHKRDAKLGEVLALATDAEWAQLTEATRGMAKTITRPGGPAE